MFYDIYSDLCRRKGISKTKAALEMGLSNATPTKWKKTRATPDLTTLQKVSAYFGVSVEDLMGDMLYLTTKDFNQDAADFIAGIHTNDFEKRLSKDFEKEKTPTANAEGVQYTDMELLTAFRNADERTRDAIRTLLGIKEYE